MGSHEPGEMSMSVAVMVMGDFLSDDMIAMVLWQRFHAKA